MAGVSTNSSALQQTVRDVVKTQELSIVTLTQLIEDQRETSASTHDSVGERKSYWVLTLVVILKALEKD
jgi:hypothetical protein